MQQIMVAIGIGFGFAAIVMSLAAATVARMRRKTMEAIVRAWEGEAE